MPPKPPKAPPTSSKAPTAKDAPAASVSNALVPVGARHLSAKRQPKRDENGDKPTTARALILRNGKHGARGTGEMMLVTKLLGREKLDLLAEDLTEKSKAALITPFNLSTCIKIADSQCSAFHDEIANLQDPNMFAVIIENEWSARKPKKEAKGDPLKTATAMAKVVANKIHNTYLLASAWRIVSDTLHDLEDENLPDAAEAQLHLKRDEALRNKFVFLYQFVSSLVKMTQERFSVLATTTPHYAPYFKIKEENRDDPSEEDYVFDWAALKEAGKSFLDSIILELSFPSAPYPMTVLYSILHDAVDESPKEAKRFPQALWDSVGDLSVSVELQALLEAPLLGPDTAGWKDATVKKPQAFEDWLDAEYLSAAASDKIANWKDVIFPLVKAKKKAVLDTMWKNINLNYKEFSGVDIDSLWQVQDALSRTPQWHALYIPSKALGLDGDGADAKTGKKKKPLQITQYGEDSDDSMPDLQSVSNSSDEDSDDEEDSDEDDDGDDDDSEYDEEFEDGIREMVREAMDTAYEDDLLDASQPLDPEIGKGNTFLKVLGSLRGRMFKRSPKIKTPVPRNPKTGFFGKSKTGAPPKKPAAAAAAAKPAPAAGPKSQKATVEEVEDEDDDTPSGPKKKKKKPKKKKKAAATTALQEIPETATTPPSSAPASPAPKKQPQSPVANLAAQMSSISLLPVEQTVGQSAHSYLKAENLLEVKSKVKSRGSEPAPEKEKKGFMAKFGLGKSKTEEVKEKKPKQNWFSGLKKKTATSMHQLLRTSEDETKGMGSMKWDVFVKLMKDMGFDYIPSTAGSSVRFDPPDPNDVPITFHKPHPDSTIHPIMLREFAKKLKKSYGWNETDFLAA
ncbi:hypothetical protein FB45DRAFT_892185 [Roridomyces roridus]|uniref:Uncharacterized protein n=1 Tax=Roridomyces roridus TaxID=1738132 RepID=A0AAD7CEN3_9AGAR|nr:hypothetical protein FB45DRAFT_892185 [Roridomyces roridus]